MVSSRRKHLDYAVGSTFYFDVASISIDVPAA